MNSIKGQILNGSTENHSTLDMKRTVPKSQGGELTPDNVTLVDPVENMRQNNNLRIRTPEMENLK